MPRHPAGVPPTAYRRAILRLARRDHTVAELRRALLQYGYSSLEVTEAIERLHREHYLDDARYAERFARSRLAQHGLGRTRIRRALRERGVARETTEAGIRTALDEVDEAATLDALARRYWKQHLRLAPERRVPRLFGFLLRRGFPPGLVHARLARLWPRWSQALEGLEPPAEESGIAADDDRQQEHQRARHRPGDES